MRILMISDVYFPRVNGVSTSIKTFQHELSLLGHDVTLIAPDYGPHQISNDWIHRIPSRYLPMDPEDRMMKSKSVLALSNTLKQDHYDIVHIQTPFVAHQAGIELAKHLDIPRVETYHTHFEECLHHYLPLVPDSWTKFAARWFNRRQCNDVDGVIVPSQPMLEYLGNQGIHRPMSVIPTGIDENFFTPGDGLRFRKEHGIDLSRPVLVHVGRVAYEKNIDFLLHMLVELQKSIPGILLIIAGEGPAERHLRDLTRTLQIENNVLFVGYLDRATSLLDCYCAGNAFIFASKIETQGLVLLEAMAQGVPVISLSAMGANDILQATKGALIARDDVTDFALKTARVLNDTGLHKQLSQEARAYARTWSAHTFATKTVSFYEQLIHQYRLN